MESSIVVERTVQSNNLRPLPGAFASVEPARRYASPKGTIALYLPRPNVVVSQVDGYLDRGIAETLKAFGEHQFVKGIACHFFHDWDTLAGYDSEMRSMLTSWSIDRRHFVRSVDVLTRSKIVAMGVATANLASSVVGVHMRSYTERAVYDRMMLRILETT